MQVARVVEFEIVNKTCREVPGIRKHKGSVVLVQCHVTILSVRGRGVHVVAEIERPAQDVLSGKIVVHSDQQLVLVEAAAAKSAPVEKRIARIVRLGPQIH